MEALDASFGAPLPQEPVGTVQQQNLRQLQRTPALRQQPALRQSSSLTQPLPLTQQPVATQQFIDQPVPFSQSEQFVQPQPVPRRSQAPPQPVSVVIPRRSQVPVAPAPAPVAPAPAPVVPASNPIPVVSTTGQNLKPKTQAEYDAELVRYQAENAKYSFSSSVSDGISDNEHNRQETRDGLKVTGMYSYKDGFFKHLVQYEADENGYRIVKLCTIDSRISKMDADNYVTFSLNGKIQKVCGMAGGTTLLQYIRDVAHLKGTKYMCREGGCGSCIVNLTFTDPATGPDKSFAINSCLYALYSCQGMSVTTIEGIGSKQEGYNPVQTRLANFYGSQCGYCSPGWVMAMYSLLKSDKTMSMKQIEDSFGSNNCRCTGYRSILDAFKSFAQDSSEELQKKVTDIEDVVTKCKRGGKCSMQCKLPYSCTETLEGCKNTAEEDDDEWDFVELALSPEKIRVRTDGPGTWFRVTSVREIFEIFTMINGTYMLIGGNTAQGVFEEKYPPPPDTYIDINGVTELKSHFFSTEGNLVVGANKTLSDTIALFQAVAVERPATFGYLKVLVKHMTKVAHIPVRNVGTLAGNLATKHKCPRFPSDLFTIYETVDVHLAIESGDGLNNITSLPEYLETDMYKKVITKIMLKPLDRSYIVKTYKVSRRAQNDHAAVNAGFCFSLDKTKNFKVLSRPSIVYGGIKPTFIHAIRTESYLDGKNLLDKGILQKALSILSMEVQPDRQLPETSMEYRHGLALSLFYKYVLDLNPSAVNPRFRSGAEDIARPLSSGRQEYFSDPQQYPLTQPLPKVESLIQCSGEIEYTNDIPPSHTELYASLVLSDRGPATLAGIDPQAALAIPGVIAFFSAKDIPGVNTFTELNPTLTIEEYEKLFADKEVQYAGQAVGVLVANNQDLADFAAQRVVVKYANVRKPLLYIEDVLTQGDKRRIKYRKSIKPSSRKGNVEYVIRGTFSDKGGQYFYYYENLNCVVYPKDNNSLDVVCATQTITQVQEAIGTMLNISQNRINIQAKRCGGAFGGKVSRPSLPTCACALSAYLLQQPVRTMMPLEANMRAGGGRYLVFLKYEVGVNSEGVIQYMDAQFYTDKGASFNDSLTINTILPDFMSVYDSSTWSVDFYDVLTDKATTTLTRAPGGVAGITSIEHIMEHIAWTVKKDPVTVKMNNAAPGSPMLGYLEDIRNRADYDSRLQYCRDFNKANQWKKRGISTVAMRFDAVYNGEFHALVSIYRDDGTVALSIGSVELGHGVNTKVSQVAAYVLGIPLVYIQVKATNNLTSPNNFSTAASTSTDGVCFAVRKCCEQINARLKPLRESLGPDVTWVVLIKEAYQQRIDLNATFKFVPGRDLKNYSVFGIVVTELEIDCLTGEHRIVRVDILQNTGNSLNPFIDIGQIEGAFLMGLGHFTSEELIYDPTTGLLTADRTWEYKVPGAKDIPEDWRIYFKKDPNTPPTGIYGSKSQGEAATVLSMSVIFAIRRAIESLHRDIGQPDTFFNNDPPCTVEATFLRCNNKLEDYTLE